VALFLLLGTHFCCWPLETCKEIEDKHWWFRGRCVCSVSTQDSCRTAATCAKDKTSEARKTVFAVVESEWNTAIHFIIFYTDLNFENKKVLLCLSVLFSVQV
jgi:hypothetical protein